MTVGAGSLRYCPRSSEHLFAQTLALWLLPASLTPSIAIACEGGGEEGVIHTTPEGTTLKFKGKVSHNIKVTNIGSGNVELISEFTSFEEAFKITKNANRRRRRY